MGVQVRSETACIRRSLAFVLSSLLSMPVLSSEAVSVRLLPNQIAEVQPAQDIGREAFDKELGQFELRIATQNFPIAAPYCRDQVILRMPGAPPDDGQREAQLEVRWALFQAFHALARGKTGQIEISIAPGPYLQADAQGKPQLQACDAYIAIGRAGR